MKREKTISTKYIKLYRIIALSVFSIFILSYATFYGFSREGVIFKIIGIAYCILMVFINRKMMKELDLIKQISYDDQYLYIHEKGTDTQIPLDRIRDVEIVSLDGKYKFHLIDKEPYGPHIYCKTSIWYPFNFKKVDKELDHVRYLIGKRKRSYYESQTNQLASNTA